MPRRKSLEVMVKSRWGAEIVLPKVILTTISSEQSTSIASAVIQDSLNGVPVNNFVFDAEASILIDEINEEYVEGSMSGNFMSLSGNSISYSVEFTAEIISAVTWCQ